MREIFTQPPGERTSRQITYIARNVLSRQVAFQQMTSSAIERIASRLRDMVAAPGGEVGSRRLCLQSIVNRPPLRSDVLLLKAIICSMTRTPLMASFPYPPATATNISFLFHVLLPTPPPVCFSCFVLSYLIFILFLFSDACREGARCHKLHAPTQRVCQHRRDRKGTIEGGLYTERLTKASITYPGNNDKARIKVSE